MLCCFWNATQDRMKYLFILAVCATAKGPRYSLSEPSLPDPETVSVFLKIDLSTSTCRSTEYG